jgi:CheY-like chemotaxis protein
MNQLRVLIINDSPDLSAIQSILLEEEGYIVSTASSGINALEVLSKDSEFNLIMLDAQLEDMSGIDFLLLLEQSQPQTVYQVPVVFLSGTQPLHPSKAVGRISDFLDIDDFLAQVRQYISVGINKLKPHASGYQSEPTLA